MNWPWKKKKLSFAETAKFNWEADTNEELRRKLNELAKQYPTLPGERVPRKAPVAVPGAGAGPQRRAAGYAAASAAENGPNAARAEGGAAGGQAIVSDRPGLPRPAATEDLYAEGHDDHTEAGGAPRRHYTSGI